MANTKTRLELTWIGKENRPRLEPRVLLEDPAKSYHAKFRVKMEPPGRGERQEAGKKGNLGDLGALAVDSVGDLFDNRLIFGDNLLALKALEQEFAGKIKCIYIDPPYNTGSAFTHYDDGVEHSLWLSLMRDRLDVLRKLLRQDGSIWVSIDDNECHYLKVLMDETFGRAEFVANMVWQSKDTPGNNATGIAETHNHLLAYRRSGSFRPKLLARSEKQRAIYTNPDDDPRGPWLPTPLTRAEHRDRDYYPIRNKAGRDVFPPKGSSWRRPPAKMKQLASEDRVWWGKSGDAEFPMEKKFLSEVKEGVVNQTWWPYEFAGSTRNASAEMKGLFGGQKIFETPKPEKLIYRVLEMATEPGDWVLDSFAGSGTTGAVAHKMGRRWILVELGEHCHTLCIPRLRKVIDGEDPGGITKAVGWKGGGGFRYYTLAPSLLQKDGYGNWIINKKYNAAMLAEAICKLAGFTYAPSETVYWQHGHSTETDFIYVTTQPLTREQLARLSEEVGEKRTLMVYCTAFRVKPTAFPNLTLKKIPKAVLSKCEWGKDDYSLEIKSLPPPAEEEEAEAPPLPRAGIGRRGRRSADDTQPTLFDDTMNRQGAQNAKRKS